MTARRYVKRHLDLAALLKTLGATRGTVLTISLVQLVCIGLARGGGRCAGGVPGAAGPAVAAQGHDRGRPAAAGLAVRCVMGFAAALLLLTGLRAAADAAAGARAGHPRAAAGHRAAATRHAARLRSGGAGDRVADPVGHRWRLALGSGFHRGPRRGAIALLALAGWLLVTLVGRLRAGTGIIWRYGAANLARRRGESILQIVALGLGLSALLLLTIVRGDLVEDWRARLPADPPNYFFVNIPGAEREGFRDLLAGQGAELSPLLPMIRGRLTAINGAPVRGRRFDRRPRRRLRQCASRTSPGPKQIGVGNKITAGPLVHARRTWQAAGLGGHRTSASRCP